MSAARITAIILAGAVGWISADAYEGGNSLLVTIIVVLIANLVGLVFGDDV